MTVTTIYAAAAATVTVINSAATATITVTATPHNVYYESSWSILSTLGIFLTLASLLVIGIVGFSLLSLLPMVNSMAFAIADGLCWYAYYSDYTTKAKLAAGVSADMFWLIHESSLPLYSFLIVRAVLHGRERQRFYCVFGFLEFAIFALRVPIAMSRAELVRQGSDNEALQTRINRLHMGYFSAISLAETWNAYFLLRTFYRARKNRDTIFNCVSSITPQRRRSSARKFSLSSRHRSHENIYYQLARSTEIRISMLALLGIFRIVTYSFQNTAQAANSVPSQLDRFAVSMKRMFPIVFLIDLLATKLVLAPRTATASMMSDESVNRVGFGRLKNPQTDASIDEEAAPPMAVVTIPHNTLDLKN